jgi:hypothetical protein
MRTLRSRGSERKGERRRGTHAADDDDSFGMSERAKPSNFPSLTTTREREREREREKPGEKASPSVIARSIKGHWNVGSC